MTNGANFFGSSSSGPGHTSAFFFRIVAGDQNNNIYPDLIFTAETLFDQTKYHSKGGIIEGFVEPDRAFADESDLSLSISLGTLLPNDTIENFTVSYINRYL